MWALKKDVQSIGDRLKLFTRETSQTLIDLKTIIRRFDEVMTQKASKISLSTVEQQLNTTLDAKGTVACSCCLTELIFESIADKKVIEENTKAQKELKAHVEEELERLMLSVTNLNFTVEKEIRNSVRRNIEKLKSEVQVRYQESNILNEDQIKKLISWKVELPEILSYLEQKSNVKDTEHSMKAIDVLHKQVKHLCVILIEVIRQEVARYTKWKDSEHVMQCVFFPYSFL